MRVFMKKYLIALDMDGTLLNSQGEISFPTLEYLKSLNKLGHKIIISSGRPIRGIMPYYQKLELSTPIICYNGAYIYPGKEKNFPEYSFSFPQKIIKEIIRDISYKRLDNVILETNEDLYLLHDDDSLDRFFNKENMNLHLGPIEDNLNQDTMTMLIKVKDTNDNEFIKQCVEKHEGIKLRFWSGHWYEISEIYYQNINKGNALKKIMEYYHMSSEDTIAFGDALNDFEMLNDAKYGFAMKNAEEELKEGHLITSFDNNEDGIMHELKKLFKKLS